MPSTALITGASSGLGMVTAGMLAAMNWHVILACRNSDKGDAAAHVIRAMTPEASLEVLPLDLASLASVRAAARVATDPDRPPIDALICNAGVQILDGIQRTSDGYELTFGTNHLGHFLLTALVCDRLAPGGRVLVVSSGVHLGPRKSLGFPGPVWRDPRILADPDSGHLDGSPRSGRIRYSTSKLANLYMTYELARRLPPGSTANAFDPGLMPETSLDRDYPQRVRRIYDLLTPLLIRVISGARSVAQSGAALAYLAAAPEFASITGAYFAGGKQAPSSPESYDRERATRLWEVSEELADPSLRR